jgi:elongation factor P
MIKAVDLRKGRAIIYEGNPCTVHDVQHVAKGNKRSYMQARLKYLRTGQIVDVRFSVDDRLETPFVEGKEFEYLYDEGDRLVLMDTATYDQITVERELVGEAIKFLRANERLTVQMLNGEPVSIELPNTVTLKVTDTPPVVKGATATNQTKDAILETGARIKVPPFIEPATKVRVDTRTGEYLERA